MNTLTRVLLAAPFIFHAVDAQAELKLPQPSPYAKVMQTVGLTEIKVKYSSPAVRERKIWGELVPYGQIWRSGANKNTIIHFSGPVTIGDTKVEGGKYSFFTIPGESEWTVVLNKNTEHWGAGGYDEAKDVVRVKVKPESTPARERLTFFFSDTQKNVTHLDLEWAGVRVRLPIHVNTDEQVSANITQEIEGLWRVPANAARYLVDNKQDLDQAMKLVEQSIELKKNWYNLMVKGLVYAEKGKVKDAIKVTKKALKHGDESGAYEFYAGQMKASLAKWEEAK